MTRSDNTAWPKIDAAGFKSKIEQAARRTPRFLFRYWTSKSGGGTRYNTPTQICPRAFATPGATPPTFFDQRHEVLRGMISDHLLTTTDDDFHTCFSSWSHSLRYILACYPKYKKKPDAHICILDTTKLGNVIVHTKPLCEILFGKSYAYPHEFLAYGVIEGDGYKAVRWEDLGKAGILSFVIDTEPYDYSTPSERFQEADAIAALFGPDFELPFLANLMTVREDDQRDWSGTARRLTEHRTFGKIPEEWREDETIMRLEVWVEGFYEVVDAMQILRHLVRNRFGQEFGNERERTPEEGRVDFEEVMEGMRTGERVPRVVGWR